MKPIRVGAKRQHHSNNAQVHITLCFSIGNNGFPKPQWLLDISPL